MNNNANVPLQKKHVVYDSLRLSISSREMDCTDVAKHMARCGILSNTTSNLTSVDGGLEAGCSILINRVTKPVLEQAVWHPLKERYQLTCAHVLVPGIFTGCVLDFLRTSLCSPS
jgi:hypothetical protein